MLAPLAAAGIADTDVQMVDFSIRSAHQRLADVRKVRRNLAKAVSVGGDAIPASVVRCWADPAPLMESAQVAAWTEVEVRADFLAGLASVTLGPVLDAHEKVCWPHRRAWLRAARAIRQPSTSGAHVG